MVLTISNSCHKIREREKVWGRNKMNNNTIAVHIDIYRQGDYFEAASSNITFNRETLNLNGTSFREGIL